MDWEGIKTLLRKADTLFSMPQTSMGRCAGYRGEDRGKNWALRRL
jgi:hypothetical protein